MTECTANHRTFWWSWWWGIVWRGWRKWRSPRTRLCSTRATKIWVVSKTVTKVRIVNIRRHRFLFSTGRRTASEDAIKHPNSSRNYLIGVNRENEPLDGTPPERLLFERSLQDFQNTFCCHLTSWTAKRATGNLQNLESVDIGQRFRNLARKTVVIKTAVLASRYPKK